MIASENTVQNEYGNDYIYNLDSHTPFKSFVSEQKNTDVKKFRFCRVTSFTSVFVFLLQIGNPIVSVMPVQSFYSVFFTSTSSYASIKSPILMSL